MLTAGVDVGGTNIEVGLVDADREVVARGKVNTPDGGPESVIAAITELIGGFDVRPAAVGVGIPGAINDGTIVHAPNLSNWTDDVELVEPLRRQLGVPVTLENDVNVGLLGEWTAGVAAGSANVVGVWMGTGIGGALVIDGRPFRGSLGAAGEIGHMVVRADGALCGCGRRGCIEAYAGRRSMADAARRMMDAGRSTALFDIQADEGKSRPTSKVWKRALDEGDEVVTALFDNAIEALGFGVGSVVNLLDPELVVIGGGMAEKLGRDLTDRIRRAAEATMLKPNPDLRFEPAALGDDSGVIGAAELARPAMIDR